MVLRGLTAAAGPGRARHFFGAAALRAAGKRKSPEAKTPPEVSTTRITSWENARRFQKKGQLRRATFSRGQNSSEEIAFEKRNGCVALRLV